MEVKLPESIKITELRHYSVSTIYMHDLNKYETMVFDQNNESVYCEIDFTLENALKAHENCIKKYKKY